jgi:LacI family transcriptional regulator
VSASTVSRALSNKGQISPATTERIKRAAEELDFRPNGLARSVFERRSYTVGIITTDAFERFTIPVMLGVENSLAAGRISVFLCDSQGDSIRERHYVDVMLGRRVDGFVVTGRSSNRRPPLPVPRGFPVVYALTPSEREEDCSVVVDDRAAGLAAGRHLTGLGRTRIALVTGPPWFEAARARADGVVQALSEAGLSLVGEPMFGEWTERWGRQAADILLRANPGLDAIYCGSDLIARGVLDTLRDLGKVVPGDVAVLGTDNWELLASGSRPPLTSVDLGLGEVGVRAAQCLLDAIDGRPHVGTVRVPCSIVARDST